MTDPTPEQIEAVARAIGDEVISAWRRTEDGSIITGDDMRKAARAAITALQTPDTQGEVSQGDARLIERLLAPDYWISGSPDGHEGMNAAPVEAAARLRELSALSSTNQREEERLNCDALSISMGRDVVVTFADYDDAFALFNELRDRSLIGSPPVGDEGDGAP